MSRYIDADALMERILKLKVVTDNMYGMGIARGIERAETAIEMQPTADVVEVRHGEWVEVNPEDALYRFTCTICGKTRLGRKTPYCANCGAKMDGERRSENEG